MSVGGPSGGPKAEINVTPLVDVVLVLLIIFMVITPMLQRGKSVALPKARQSEKKSTQDKALILSMTPDKKLYLDNDSLDEKALENRLREEIVREPMRKILLKADNSLRVGDVRKVMKVARNARASRVSLGVEELKP
jgi:biopolymer transport protein ExbD